MIAIEKIICFSSQEKGTCHVREGGGGAAHTRKHQRQSGGRGRGKSYGQGPLLWFLWAGIGEAG